MQKKQGGYCVAVVGATGAVGREMIKVLEERDFPVAELRLYASPRSLGESIEFKGKGVAVDVLPEDPPDDIDIALFSAGSSVSKKAGPAFVSQGAVVIDNSSAWRMDRGVPLVVPEVNPDRALDALSATGKGIVANPNCSTIQLVVALKPLADAFGLERVVISTYQSVSGAGQAGIKELSEQVVSLFNNRDLNSSAFPHTIAFNCIPAIGAARDDGYTEEEWKLVTETRKILALPDLRVSPTAVRVPVFACHSESVHVQCSRKVTPKQARAALAQGEGLVIQDRLAENEYPMGGVAAGTDDVFVGRIRQDPDDDCSLNFWIVADNLRKGAALNAVQIAEALDEGLDQ
ncbi:MAG: aspartate-semialdehyde dehydrogenase [Deltaproteobacteria bacterium]|nr:aspartate-semialdehyde dehydrogenase [Deltaproteobacteria bacterium]